MKTAAVYDHHLHRRDARRLLRAPGEDYQVPKSSDIVAIWDDRSTLIALSPDDPISAKLAITKYDGPK